jgi:hypothetical protein
MFRYLMISVIFLDPLSKAMPAPLPKEAPKLTGILVFDDCDPKYRGKQTYEDNLTLIDSFGKKMFRLSGFNNCQSIGSNRAIAVDSVRKCIWVIENVAHRIRRFDFTGKETGTINEIKGSAIAVDPSTGNVWALVGDGIGSGKTVVFNDKGDQVASYDISGWDIVYDKKEKAFWIAERKLTKITAEKGKVLFSIPISRFCASSLDIDPTSGAVWVAVREHPQIAKSKNQLMKFDSEGENLVTIELENQSPSRVSVDPKSGAVWASLSEETTKRFSAKGILEETLKVEAMAIQVDSAGSDVWIVTSEEIQKRTPKGEITKTLKHAGKTLQGWIAVLE